MKHGPIDPVARLEIRMPSERRRQLAQLADKSGISAADLARLALNQLLDERQVRLPAATERQAA